MGCVFQAKDKHFIRTRNATRNLFHLSFMQAESEVNFSIQTVALGDLIQNVKL